MAQEPDEELPRPAVVVLWLFARLGREFARSSSHLILLSPPSSREAPLRRAAVLGISRTAETLFRPLCCGRDADEADLTGLRLSPRLGVPGAAGLDGALEQEPDIFPLGVCPAAAEPEPPFLGGQGRLRCNSLHMPSRSVSS